MKLGPMELRVLRQVIDAGTLATDVAYFPHRVVILVKLGLLQEIGHGNNGPLVTVTEAGRIEAAKYAVNAPGPHPL